MPSPEEVADYTVSRVLKTLEDVQSFAGDDPTLLDQAHQVQLRRITGKQRNEGRKDNHQFREWSAGQAAFQILFGLVAGNETVPPPPWNPEAS